MTWLAQAALVGSVLLAAGCLGAVLCRQPVRRLRLMELTLVGCLLAPAVTLLPGLPRLALPWPAVQESAIRSQRSEVRGQRSEEMSVRPAVHSAAQPAVARADTRTDAAVPAPGVRTHNNRTVAHAEPASAPAPAAVAVTPQTASLWPDVSLPVLLLLVYGLAGGWLFLRWLAGFIELVRLRRKARPVPAFVRELFRSLAGSAGERVELLASDHLAVPVTFGWRRPVLVVPASLCTTAHVSVLRCCLAHEWSHIERRDIRVWHLATVAQFLFFYQPFFWWLRRQVRLCQDFLADARAAEQADSAEDYATYLLGLARRRLRLSAGLGVADKRSNLYRRILMLVHNRQPLERTYPRRWNAGITLAGLGLLALVACVRLEATAKDEAPARGDKPAKIEVKKTKALTYTGQVRDKVSGKPIAGAVVTVRRSVYTDPKTGGNRVLESTNHTTNAKGKYTFTIPAEQVAETRLYIELDVHHPDYAAQEGFGYALAMILKNERMGGRPFFENIELYPGKPVTGKVETPDGKPAAGVQVLAFSAAPKQFPGSFSRTRTDKDGRFRVVMATPGNGVLWLMPDEYAPSLHVFRDKRGDMGIFGLQKGIVIKGKVLDAKGKPAASVEIEARREGGPGTEALAELIVADAIGRRAETNSRGEFEMAPLPPGNYELKPSDFHFNEKTREFWRKELPGVYIGQKLTLKEGESPDPVELVAVPTVTIEAQYLDSKGKPRSGHEIMLFGRRGKGFWFGQGHPDAHGHILAQAPLGLEDTQIQFMTNEHSSLRHRMTKGGPLSHAREERVGTLKGDLRGIQIIRYEAPIVRIKVTARDGSKLKDAKMSAVYGSGKPGFFPVEGPPTDIFFEKQEDGRFRSEQLLPDEDVTFTAHAEGYKPASIKLRLPERAEKSVELVLEKDTAPKATKAQGKTKAKKQ
jgi:beta-lactamase regulating signal transducer with metallopeptidase domain/5-hydroxyisourate hydrolase-like protein (transthyretin family)